MKQMLAVVIALVSLAFPQFSRAQQYNVWVLEPGVSTSTITVNVVGTQTWFTDNLMHEGRGMLGPWPWCCQNTNHVHRLSHAAYIAATSPDGVGVDWNVLGSVSRVGGPDISGVDQNGNVTVTGPDGQSVSIPAELAQGLSPQDLADLAAALVSQESLVNGFEATAAQSSESVGSTSYGGSGSQDSTGAEYE